MGEINIIFVHSKPGLIKAFFKLLMPNSAQCILIAEIINDELFPKKHWSQIKKEDYNTWHIKTKKDFFKGKYSISKAKALVKEYCFSVLYENIGMDRIINES